jgi:Tol biopolymer transport system component
MKRIIFILLLLTYITTYAQDVKTVTLRDSARIFGKGVISTGDFVFNASFTPAGTTVYFSKSAVNFGYIVIFSSTKQASGWTSPKPVSFTGVYRDTDPFVSADGKRLYFASDRPFKGAPFKDYEYHYYYVELDGDKVVSDPIPFILSLPPEIKTTYLSLADNGNAYFFSSDGVADADIYVCKLKNGNYLPPEKLPFNDKKYFDFDPVIAGDESFIIFCSPNRNGGVGSGDLWVSFKKDITWTEPINMGPKINTRGNDGAPGLSRDHKTLYFTSFRETTDRPVYKDGKVTADAINKLLHSTKNGMRSIYEIDISDLKAQ